MSLILQDAKPPSEQELVKGGELRHSEGELKLTDLGASTPKQALSRWSVLVLTLGVCFVYWIYLFFTSRMSLTFDAVGYEYLGRVISEQGWVEYLRGGPNREPLYPFLISISMQLGSFFGVNYHWFQKALQIVVLLLTQILSFVLLKKLGIDFRIQIVTLLYIGFSPALTNSAFSLYSEIITYPFVLGLVFAGYHSWRIVKNTSMKQVWLGGILTGILFLGMGFNKIVYHYVFMFFMLPFFGLAARGVIRRNVKGVSRILLYCLVVATIVEIPIISYKLFNLKYNGQFQFTNRVVPQFYGNVVQRTQKHSPRILGAYVASIPGDGVCRYFFSERECKYVEFQTVDWIFGLDLPKLLKDVPVALRNAKTLEMAFDHIREKPLQYVLFMMIEGSKMFFWETTRLGNVDYSATVRALYENVAFKNTLRLVISLLTLMAFGYVVLYCASGWTKKAVLTATDRERIRFLSFAILIIVSHIGIYSLSYVLTRFALPIVPLFLIFIAFSVQSLLVKRKVV